MKRKTFIAFMIIFTAYISVTLFISLICGAPMGSRAELNRYLFGAVGMAMILPAGFSFFFVSTFYLSKRLDEIERAESENIFNTMDFNLMIKEFVNTLSIRKKLTREGKERLLTYLENL